MKTIKFWLVVFALSQVSCEEIISVTDISEEIVVIQSPVSGTEISTTEVQFSWVPLEFAETYQIQVARPSFAEATAVVLDTIIIDSIGQMRDFKSNIDSGSYEWRIRAGNSAYETVFTNSDFQVLGAFEFTEQSVNITSPENEFVTSEPQVIIQWESIPEAEIYRVIVVNVETEEVLYEISTESTLINIDFMNAGLYEYSIRAETMAENTDFSSQTITIE